MSDCRFIYLQQLRLLMKKKTSWQIVLLFLVAAFAIWQLKTKNATPQPPSKNITYTQHARCRMQCRHIDETEIAEIINQGHINPKKSNAKDKPCPTIAYEGVSHDQQHIRVVAAQCNGTLKIVTCIDLKTDYPCQCN